jgi:hypothetical protein
MIRRDWRFNAISHERHTQVANRKPSPLYSRLHCTIHIKMLSIVTKHARYTKTRKTARSFAAYYIISIHAMINIMQRQLFYIYRKRITCNWWRPTYITYIYYLCCFAAGNRTPVARWSSQYCSHHESYLRTRQKGTNHSSAGSETSYFIDRTILPMSWIHPYTQKANDCYSVTHLSMSTAASSYEQEKKTAPADRSGSPVWVSTAKATSVEKKFLYIAAPFSACCYSTKCGILAYIQLPF